ncbi:mechanosensitive ion channel (plasmid) [Cytobacillus spongiae]|uniref:mechanosensitive ion channel family protein n=1 Tax=Cytobacillus spongiae TaxID=2901381 RepID=UPI001F3C8E4F|nr:mechanosensitive ion channel domain-containing protein [Cytobacillus spongiae]UII58267.1 mechanosensitive ion channel [Cytobacillus spongiae]
MNTELGKVTNDWYLAFEQFDWMNLLIFLIYVSLIFLVRMIILSFTKRMKNSDKKWLFQMDSLVRYLLNWLTTYGILLFILFYFSDSSWMFREIVSVGKVKVTFFLLIIAILIISIANRSSKMITKYLLPAIYQRYDLDRGVQFTFDKMFHYSIMVLAIFISLTTVGIDLSALTVFAGIIGVGIGFGLQNIASNFISGIILLFERPIKVGDRVIVNEVIGDVEKINMRATIIKTLDNEHIIVPNSYFLEEQVVNRSYSDPRHRLVIPVGVAYGSDVEHVRKLLLEVAEAEEIESETVLIEPKPFVNFVGFGSSSLDFELFVWITNPDKVIPIKSSLHFRIYKALTDNKIEIPFPQQDLHVRTIDKEAAELFKK